MSTLIYKNEINTLRAIAVLGVIFYHFDNKFTSIFISGGHLGVDIFFFISGYLISRIIFFELKNRKFTFRDFYLRRIRRIIPLLFFIILVLIFVSYNFLLPQTLKDFSQSVFFLTFYLSNILFWHESVSYAEKSNEFKPLLHTWSLSVEEQFYILAPFVFYILFKKKNFIYKIIFLTILSYILNIILSKKFANFNFFWIIGRVWEFGLGSIIAYYHIAYKNKINHKFFLFPILGLIIIIFSFIYLDFNKYPSPNALTIIPILGSIIVILFYKRNLLNIIIFENKYITYIGLISYSLYLWHFPIFSFAKIFDLKSSSLNSFIIFLSLFALSLITWKFIEKPFRNKNFITDKKIIFLVIIFSIFFLLFGIFGHLTGGYNKRFDGNNFFPIKKGDLFFETSCNERQLENICTSKINNTDKFLILYGDSLAEHIAKPIYEMTKQFKLNFKVMSGSGCFIIPGVTIKDKDRNIICENIKNYSDYILSQKNQIIILSGRFSYYLLGEGFDNKEGGVEKRSTKWILKDQEKLKKNIVEDILKKFIEDLAINNKVILIYPIPEVGWEVGDKLFYRSSETFNNWKKFGLNTSYNVFKERNKKIYEIFNKIDNANVIRIFPESIFCDNEVKNRCITHDDKKIYYIDNSHLSYDGGFKLSEIIFSNLKFF